MADTFRIASNMERRYVPDAPLWTMDQIRYQVAMGWVHEAVISESPNTEGWRLQFILRDSYERLGIGELFAKGSPGKAIIWKSAEQAATCCKNELEITLVTIVPTISTPDRFKVLNFFAYSRFEKINSMYWEGNIYPRRPSIHCALNVPMSSHRSSDLFESFPDDVAKLSKKRGFGRVTVDLRNWSSTCYQRPDWPNPQ